MPQGGAYFTGKLGMAPGGQLIWYPCTWLVGTTSLGNIEPVVPASHPTSARTVAY
jgi:hypothetical protein